MSRVGWGVEKKKKAKRGSEELSLKNRGIQFQRGKRDKHKPISFFFG